MGHSMIRRTGLLLGVILTCGVIGDVFSDEPSAAHSRGAFHLRLIWSSVPPSIVDVDDGNVRRVSGVMRTTNQGLWLTPVPGGALASAGGPRSARAVLIRPDGSTRFLVRAASVVGAWNAPAAWALRARPGGGCTVRLVPGYRKAVPAPCGSLEADGAAGIVVSSTAGEVLVDHRTGRVRAHVRGDEAMLMPLRGELIFELTTSPTDGVHSLSLVDLATGRRRALRWPSDLADIDGVVPEPGGALVAVDFASVASSPQGEDIFILDTRDGRFTHVPGYPILEDLKRSSVAWTRDGRLVLTIGRGDTTTLGLYHPGDRTVLLRRIELPPLAGSDTFVPITSRS
jgi:hypothetical protein